jgi:hypothetical protein
VPDGLFEVKDRRSGERVDVPVDQVVDHMLSAMSAG